MTLTDILLLIIALGGAFYFGYIVGRRSVLERGADQDILPMPEPDLPRTAPADVSGEQPRRAAPPPASAGGSTQQGQREIRRTAKPPPARAGLLGSGGSDGKKG